MVFVTIITTAKHAALYNTNLNRFSACLQDSPDNNDCSTGSAACLIGSGSSMDTFTTDGKSSS